MTGNQALEQQRAEEKAKLVTWLKEPEQAEGTFDDRVLKYTYPQLAANIEGGSKNGVDFLNDFYKYKTNLINDAKRMVEESGPDAEMFCLGNDPAVTNGSFLADLENMTPTGMEYAVSSTAAQRIKLRNLEKAKVLEYLHDPRRANKEKYQTLAKQIESGDQPGVDFLEDFHVYKDDLINDTKAAAAIWGADKVAMQSLDSEPDITFGSAIDMIENMEPEGVRFAFLHTESKREEHEKREKTNLLAYLKAREQEKTNDNTSPKHSSLAEKIEANEEEGIGFLATFRENKRHLLKEFSEDDSASEAMLYIGSERYSNKRLRTAIDDMNNAGVHFVVSYMAGQKLMNE